MNNFCNYPIFNNRNISSNRCLYSQKSSPKSKKKVSLKCLKNNACTSLNDVEKFLGNCTCFMKYIKLYCLLKK